MISLKQLRYALAVEKHLHFKKAADECAVSQSALSAAITELEKQLGLQVFERDNKKVLVTPLGKQLLIKARKINMEVDDLYQLSQSQKAPLSYPMSMGVIPTIGPYLLPRVLPALRLQYPDLQLRIIEEQSSVLLDKVKSGELDTAILALPYNLEGLLAFEFWKEDFFWVAHHSEDHALQKEITSDELRQTRLMLLEDGHCLKDHALAACHLPSNESSNTFGSTSLLTLTQMAAGRIGTTLVPEMALEQLIYNSRELKAVHLNEPGPHRKIAFIVRPNYVNLNNIELLMMLFNQQLQLAFKGSENIKNQRKPQSTG